MTAGEYFAKPPSSYERKSSLDSQKTWLAPHKVHTATQTTQWVVHPQHDYQHEE